MKATLPLFELSFLGLIAAGVLSSGAAKKTSVSTATAAAESIASIEPAAVSPQTETPGVTHPQSEEAATKVMTLIAAEVPGDFDRIDGRATQPRVSASQASAVVSASHAATITPEKASPAHQVLKPVDSVPDLEATAAKQPTAAEPTKPQRKSLGTVIDENGVEWTIIDSRPCDPSLCYPGKSSVK